jgi:uncharacterized protein (TIGR03086 family)
MDAKTLFAKAIEQAAHCVAQTSPEDLTRPTPCSEWDLQALLNHLVYELLWVPELVKGKTVSEVGGKYDGDVLRSDFQASFKHAADAATMAVHQADLKAIAHLSYGDVSMESYINEIADDVLIHSWDICQALNASLIFEREVCQAVYDNVYPRRQEFADSGLFGTPLEVAADAPLQSKLLALVGRKG